MSFLWKFKILQDEIEGLRHSVKQPSRLSLEDAATIELANERIRSLILASSLKSTRASKRMFETTESLIRLSKEIEFQTLEIQLSEKRMKEFEAQLIQKARSSWTLLRPTLVNAERTLSIRTRSLNGIIKGNRKKKKRPY